LGLLLFIEVSEVVHDLLDLYDAFEESVSIVIGSMEECNG